MVLWTASAIKPWTKRTGSAYRHTDTTNHAHLAKTGVVTRWDEILVHRIDASGCIWRKVLKAEPEDRDVIGGREQDGEVYDAALLVRREGWSRDCLLVMAISVHSVED